MCIKELCQDQQEHQNADRHAGRDGAHYSFVSQLKSSDCRRSHTVSQPAASSQHSTSKIVLTFKMNGFFCRAGILNIQAFVLDQVTIQLLSKSEKERFDNLVNIMIGFNFFYRQEKGMDGQFHFILEP